MGPGSRAEMRMPDEDCCEGRSWLFEKGRVNGCDAVFAGGRAEYGVGGHYEKAKELWGKKVVVARGGAESSKRDGGGEGDLSCDF
jgi:hypothetical protein